MNTMMTDSYLMLKPISLVNLICKVFVSDGKTGHLRKVCNNMYTNIFFVFYLISIRYSTIETKEFARIGYNGFPFLHEYSGEGQGRGA